MGRSQVEITGVIRVSKGQRAGRRVGRAAMVESRALRSPQGKGLGEPLAERRDTAGWKLYFLPLLRSFLMLIIFQR